MRRIGVENRGEASQLKRQSALNSGAEPGRRQHVLFRAQDAVVEEHLAARESRMQGLALACKVGTSDLLGLLARARIQRGSR